MGEGMNRASLNVNGLRSHLDEIELLIRSLDFHVLALKETKLILTILKNDPACLATIKIG